MVLLRAMLAKIIPVMGILSTSQLKRKLYMWTEFVFHYLLKKKETWLRERKNLIRNPPLRARFS